MSPGPRPASRRAHDSPSSANGFPSLLNAPSLAIAHENEVIFISTPENKGRCRRHYARDVHSNVNGVPLKFGNTHGNASWRHGGARRMVLHELRTCHDAAMRKQASNLGNALVGRDDHRRPLGIYLRQCELKSRSARQSELSSRPARRQARARDEDGKTNHREEAHEGS